MPPKYEILVYPDGTVAIMDIWFKLCAGVIKGDNALNKAKRLFPSASVKHVRPNPRPCNLCSLKGD